MIQDIIHHPRFADGAAVVSGSTAVASHWFVTASELAKFGANVVTIGTGTIAIAHYAPLVWRAAKNAYARVLLRRWISRQ